MHKINKTMSQSNPTTLLISSLAQIYSRNPEKLQEMLGNSLHSGQLCVQLESLWLGIRGQYWGTVHIFHKNGIRQKCCTFKGFQQFKVNGFHLSNLSVSHLSNKRVLTGWPLSFLPVPEHYDLTYTSLTRRACTMIHLSKALLIFDLLQTNTFCWRHIWSFLQWFSLLNMD